MLLDNTVKDRLFTLQETNTELFIVDINGLAIAQAVSLQLPTTAALVQFQIRSCGRQSGTGAGCLRVCQFPLPILTPQKCTIYSSSGAGTMGQLVVDVPSGLSRRTPRSLKTKLLGSNIMF
jgi:hypothetical protein